MYEDYLDVQKVFHYFINLIRPSYSRERFTVYKKLTLNKKKGI